MLLHDEINQLGAPFWFQIQSALGFEVWGPEVKTRGP